MRLLAPLPCLALLACVVHAGAEPARVLEIRSGFGVSGAGTVITVWEWPDRRRADVRAVRGPANGSRVELRAVTDSALAAFVLRLDAAGVMAPPPSPYPYLTSDGDRITGCTGALWWLHVRLGRHSERQDRESCGAANGARAQYEAAVTAAIDSLLVDGP